MPAEVWLRAEVEWSVDRCLMQSLMVLSSNDTVRMAAAAWLSAFDAARAAGATAEDAAAIAAEATPNRGASLPAGP